MKTKEQILKWLDEQPWANEFYKTAFLRRIHLYNDDRFISSAFIWEGTEEGKDVWEKRDEEFREWYDSNDKPMSWKVYCEQNPIKEDDRYIGSDGERCTTMSKDLCKAFLAYMKLIQLRNAWVKGVGICARRIVPIQSEDDGFNLVYGETGLSFPTPEMANEFIKTFKDLLEVAKPLI